MSSKKALCVGINAYASPNQLHGCVNDANTWAKTLQGLGFQTEVMTDAQATRQGMLDALNKLVHGAKSGDVLVFQYSGHGTQVKDLDGDETDDAKDESLCPVDIDKGAFLIDDDLFSVFGGLAQGVNFTVFLDCCHSGTSTRAFSPFRPAAPEDKDAKRRFIAPSEAQDRAHEEYRRSVAGSRAVRPVGAMRWVNFSACQPEEVAWERNGQGDFTRFGTGVLSGGADFTNEAFQKAVVAAFGGSPAQHPYLDCTDAARAQPLMASQVGGLGLGEIVGVFCENGQFRLDIGTWAVKEAVPASHDSWATRLRVQRLDGESSGPVAEDHVVGIFSEDEKWRLDIGTWAMKKNIPASHNSWATRLYFAKVDGTKTGPLEYGDVVGVFCENGKYRLDIGERAMKKNIPASHNSWATRLHVRKL